MALLLADKQFAPDLGVNLVLGGYELGKFFLAVRHNGENREQLQLLPLQNTNLGIFSSF